MVPLRRDLVVGRRDEVVPYRGGNQILVVHGKGAEWSVPYVLPYSVIVGGPGRFVREGSSGAVVDRVIWVILDGLLSQPLDGDWLVAIRGVVSWVGLDPCSRWIQGCGVVTSHACVGSLPAVDSLIDSSRCQKFQRRRWNHLLRYKADQIVWLLEQRPPLFYL